MTLAIHALPKPVIAAINGAAVGIGATMTLAMDLRLASTTARIGFVFGRLGIVPEAASSWFLPRIVGIQQALEWVYSADILDADAALAGRLVRSLHEPDELLPAAQELARSFVVDRSPVALALAKQLLYRNSAAADPLEAHLSDSLAMFYASIGDGKEGVAAFLEKRDPRVHRSGLGPTADLLIRPLPRRVKGMADINAVEESADTDIDIEEDTTRLASEVGEDESRAEWAVAARDLLLVAAHKYRAVVTQRELADGVQEQTGLHTTQRVQQWIGDVLTLVAKDCAARDEPSLASLCVDATGSVGAAYAATLLATSGDEPEDADRHAALVRLECYTHFDAPDLPADGGLAALTPKLEGSRARTKKAAVAARPINMCPVCFMSIPPNGTCVNCD